MTSKKELGVVSSPHLDYTAELIPLPSESEIAEEQDEDEKEYNTELLKEIKDRSPSTERKPV